MKPYYVVLLMGAAAIGGGLVVRYSDHPVEITLAHSLPPAVVAPPIPPSARVGPSNSVPVRSAPREAPAVASAVPETPAHPAPEKPEKPSALSSPVRVARSEATPAEPRMVMRVRVPPDSSGVTLLDHSSVAAAVPAPAPAPAPQKASTPTPAPPAPILPPPPPEPNHATLRAGMLIAVRVNEALSSNLNSAGDVFSGVLERPLIADGFVIAERGSRIRGEVVESKSPNRGAGQGLPELTLRLREVVASDGQRVHLVSDPWRKLGLPPAGNDAAAGRTGSVYDIALTRGGAAVVRPATSITFRLGEAVALTEKK